MSDSTNVAFPDDAVDFIPSEDTGYPDWMAERDTSENYAQMNGMIEFPDYLDIPESDWKDVARENDKHNTWPDDYANRLTNQTPTHECTCHCLLQCFEIVWNKQFLSQDRAVYVSALSIYLEANPRQWGGSTMQRTLAIARDRGFLPDHDGPAGRGTQKNKFDHTLHLTAGNSDHNSNGPWVAMHQLPRGWKGTAANFRIDKYVNIRNWRQTVCMVLNGYPVGVGRWGHAIPYTKIVWRNGQLHAEYRDSYVIKRYDSMRGIQASVGGAYSPLSTTALSQWEDTVPVPTSI